MFANVACLLQPARSGDAPQTGSPVFSLATRRQRPRMRRCRSGRPRLWYIVVVILMALSLSLSLSNFLFVDLVSTIEIIVYTILPHPSHRLASDSRPPFFILGRRHGGHDRLPLSGKAPVTIAPRWGWAPLARA